MGPPFRPSPTSLAGRLWEFGARTSAPDAAPDFTGSPDFQLANWAVGTDSFARIDIAGDLLTQLSRVLGYVSPIEESRAARNTDTGYRFETVCRFRYRIKDFGTTPADFSMFYRRIRDFGPNSLMCPSPTMRL